MANIAMYYLSTGGGGLDDTMKNRPKSAVGAPTSIEIEP